MRRLSCALVTVLCTLACGNFERDSNPGCCYYTCDGGREALFSSYFAGAELCESIAVDRCGADDEEMPGLTQFEWRSEAQLTELPPDTVTATAVTLDMKCPVNQPQWFQDS